MMNKQRSKLLLKSLLITGVILSITPILLTTAPFLKQFTVVRTSHILCKIEQPQFALSWIHSVDKTPWVEYYERQNTGFLLTTTKFKTFGAGVPHDGEVIESHDSMIHYRINQLMTEINWIIDTDVRSTIILPDNQHWEIYKQTDRYSEVEFRNQFLNFWQRLTIRNCHES